ncbi:MAG: hypothetical protein ACR2LX_04465 [Jatrophihabitans sp.]
MPSPEKRWPRGGSVQARKDLLYSRVGDGGITGGTTRVGQLTSRFNKSRREINDAIHKVKAKGDFPGNPDVVVDEAGEVYPLGHGGVAGESIGNILDYLGD